MNSVHLTDDQIDEHLIGDLSDDLTMHLDGCAECQARVAEMEEPISSFKDVSLAWSERQSATMPIRPAGLPADGKRGHRALWAATATAAVAIGVAIPLTHRESKAPGAKASHTASVPAQTFTAEREQQIAQDNQMLLDIDRELSPRVSSPSETFGLDASTVAPRGPHNTSVRD